MRTRLVWSSKSSPNRAAVGRLVRWREVSRGRWQYGYYLGREEGIAKIGLTPEGPPVIWTHGFYPEVQGAYVEVVPEPTDSGAGDVSS